MNLFFSGSFSESNYSAEGSAQVGQLNLTAFEEIDELISCSFFAQSIAQKGSVHSLSSQGEEYFYALDQLPEDQYPSNMYTTFRGPSVTNIIFKRTDKFTIICKFKFKYCIDIIIVKFLIYIISKELMLYILCLITVN